MLLCWLQLSKSARRRVQIFKPKIKVRDLLEPENLRKVLKLPFILINLYWNNRQNIWTQKMSKAPLRFPCGKKKILNGCLLDLTHLENWVVYWCNEPLISTIQSIQWKVFHCLYVEISKNHIFPPGAFQAPERTWIIAILYITVKLITIRANSFTLAVSSLPHFHCV